MNATGKTTDLKTSIECEGTLYSIFNSQYKTQAQLAFVQIQHSLL
jgi:hypothetical protein